MSRNLNINKSGIYLIYLTHRVSQIAKENNIKYLDYGISTEDNGSILNLGLSKFKQSSYCGESNCRYLFKSN